MSNDSREPKKAFENEKFLHSRTGRPIRILSEHLEPEARFEQFGVSDTIVFFGSARFCSHDDASTQLDAARKAGGDVKAAENRLAMSRYYEAARQLANRLTHWSKNLEGGSRRFVVCTGGGPGIMEAANRGASEAKGLNIGLNISLPHEQNENPFLTRELAFEFHYFFMRKFWFIYLAKALVIFPGGFGTFDEFFEVMTLVQTRKVEKKMPIVVFGREFWSEVIDFQALVRRGVIDGEDLNLFKLTDSVDEAYRFITGELIETALAEPGGRGELI
jgi:hypothetical protein